MTWRQRIAYFLLGLAAVMILIPITVMLHVAFFCQGPGGIYFAVLMDIIAVGIILVLWDAHT